MAINIIAQCITFLIAGHETTSGLLSFALYELIKHPKVLERGYEEVDRVLGGDVNARQSGEKLDETKRADQKFMVETVRHIIGRRRSASYQEGR